MNNEVRAAFFGFSTQFEGQVEYMYVDVKDLVTIGIGNLIDPVERALGLPFVFKSDSSVNAQESDIRADFQAVTSDPSLAQKGHLACRDLTQLKLTDAAINDLVFSKVEQFSQTLKRTTEFADLEDWPADGQLALLSMAWAAGPTFGPGFPAFRAACSAKDWATAAVQSHMADENNPGLRPRNVANHVLFMNAGHVVDNGLDATTLKYVVSGSRSSVRQGSSGDDVTFLQSRLSTLSCNVQQTGLFDATTDAAVRAFQTDQGLTSDGIVGQASWAALGTCLPASAARQQ